MEEFSVNHSESLTKASEKVILDKEKENEIVDWDEIFGEGGNEIPDEDIFDWGAFFAGKLDEDTIKAEFGEELYKQYRENKNASKGLFSFHRCKFDFPG